MKISKILRKAAVRIEREWSTYSCCAITEDDELGSINARIFFIDLYKPDAPGVDVAYWADSTTRKKGWEGPDVRVIALCLAADIAESEGK